MQVCFLSLLKRFRLRRCSVAVLVLLAALVPSLKRGLLHAAPPDQAAEPEKAAIIYDSAADPRVESYIHALFLANLLTHFNFQATLIPLSEYKRGELGEYSAGFLVASGLNTTIPPVLITDIRADPALCLAGAAH